jgi:membrane associated rhomboid family serine protease
MNLLVIIVTAMVSIAAFRQRDLFYKMCFVPYQVVHRKQWYRIFSHAFIHANWEHLAVNMFVLFSFGHVITQYFDIYFSQSSILLYIGLYGGGIVVSSVFTLFKEKDNFNYNAVGASGAVSAVAFASIFFSPLSKILFFGIIPIPGIVFGIVYLAYSYYMGKRNVDNVGHDAHFWGAVYGFVYPMLIRPELFNHFIEQLIP